MNEREQIITFLLQACDLKDKVIEELQKQISEFQKQAATAVAVTTAPVAA
jgi:hypothetical protein